MSSALKLSSGSVKLDVSAGSAESYSNDAARSQLVRVIATVPVHLATNQAATDEDAYLPAESAIVLLVDPGESLSILSAAGAGTAWVSLVKLMGA